jgi:hypothetical protein
MRVDFRFNHGQQVEVLDDSHPTGRVGTVQLIEYTICGEKCYHVTDNASGALLKNRKGQFSIKESDLKAVGDAPPDPEPHFDLLAHDTLAAETVRFWVHLAEESGHVPKAKIDGAIAIADAMDAWPHHRLPD